MYMIFDFSKITEIASYGGDEVGQHQCYDVDIELTAKTPVAMLDEIKKFFNARGAQISVNPCGGEPGRIDIQRLEKANTLEPTPQELQEWRAGRLTLWNVTYSGILNKIIDAAF